MADSDNIDLKKRARRRLVGAAGLMLLAVIILPMVMDEEPVLTAPDVQVVIPDKEGDNLVARPMVGEPALPQPEPMVTPAAEPVEVEEEVPASPGLNMPAPALPPPATAQPVPPPARVPPPAPLPPPPPRAPANPDAEAARVQAILSGQVPAVRPPPAPMAQAPAAAQSGNHAVQTGAFRDGSTATAQRDRLRAAGFPAYTERAGEATRVRIGPFPSRAAADQALARLRAGGFDGVVVNR